MAAQVHMPLSKAAERIDLLKQLTPRAAAGLDEFIRIVHRLRAQSEHMTPAELTRELVDKSGLLAAAQAQSKDKAGFERRKENFEELASWFEAARGGGPGELAAQLALLGHADRGEPGNAVRLMSLHAAKGLEFRVVFIIGCEDGTLPHEASIEEGRRLLYVGITRANEALWLSHSRETKRWGGVEQRRPSRFLDELPAAD